VDVGGKQRHNAHLPAGAYFDGTVVGDATPEMGISQTERKSVKSGRRKLLIYSSSVCSCCSSDEI
jgi:hypothetical protein